MIDGQGIFKIKCVIHMYIRIGQSNIRQSLFTFSTVKVHSQSRVKTEGIYKSRGPHKAFKLTLDLKGKGAVVLTIMSSPFKKKYFAGLGENSETVCQI